MRIILIILVILSMRVYSNESYSPIYPTTISINLDRGKKVGEFRIFNTSEKMKNFEVEIRDKDNFNEETILKDHLKIFPRAFSLKPGEAKIVRVMVKDFPQKLMQTGEYRGAIYVRGLTSKIENKYKNRKNEGISTSIDVKIDVSMAVYVQTGNEITKVELISKKKKLTETEIEIKNIGNYSYEAVLKGFDKKGNEVSKSYPTKLIAGRVQKVILAGKRINEVKIYKIDENKKEEFISKY